MGAAPNACPMCGAYREWKMIDSSNYHTGVSTGKAIAGGLLFGGVGAIIGGFSGKKKTAKTYVCSQCGFSHTYS